VRLFVGYLLMVGSELYGIGVAAACPGYVHVCVYPSLSGRLMMLALRIRHCMW
jgi:hypothetical protein